MQEKNTKKNTASSTTSVYIDLAKDKIPPNCLDDILVKAIQEPPGWWGDLAPMIDGSKTRRQFIEQHKELLYENYSVLFSAGTVKRCPGIINHLASSILIKSPCDIMIRTNEKNYQWRAPSDILDISYHNDNQVGGSLPYHIIKFMLPMCFKTDSDVQATFIKPIYYKDFGYDLAPGQIETGSSVNQLNIIALFPKKEAEYFIPADSILAILQFTKRVSKIKLTNLSEEYAKYEYLRKKYIASVVK